MVYPVVAYGHPVLRKKAEPITADYNEFEVFMANLWETMYVTDGIGLAAPQVNRSIRIFVLDANVLAEKYPEGKGFKKAFINPVILEEEGEEWVYSEGCLSIPDIHEDVLRKPKLLIHYQDEQFNHHEEWFEGIVARIIQHEYDHLQGVMFTDRLSNIRKMLLKRKLNDISKGFVKVDYKMIFPLIKKGR